MRPHPFLPGSAIKSSGLLYLELLCQLATEAIKHGQVKGTKVCIEAARGGGRDSEREGDRDRRRKRVSVAIYATSYSLWGSFTGWNQLASD